MKSIQVFFEQKLSRRFVLWFSITLSFPLLGLLFFAINSFNDRQKLLNGQVSEYQQERVIRIEEFYQNNFYKGYQKAIRGVFNKIDKQGFVKAEFDPNNFFSKSAVTSQYTAYHYNQILPYLGIQIEPDSNFIKELNSNVFLPVHFLKLYYSSSDWHDFYDGLALSSISAVDKGRYQGSLERSSTKLRNLFNKFRLINSLRKKWVSNRKYPVYKTLQENEILPNINSITSKELDLVFKSYPALSRFSTKPVLKGLILNELRSSINLLLRDRFEILEKIVRMRTLYKSVIEGLQDGDFQKLSSFCGNQKPNFPTRSLNCLSLVSSVIGLNNSYQTSLNSLSEIYKDSLSQLVSRYGEGSDLKLILRNNGFADELVFLKRYKPDSSQNSNEQVAVLNPLYYLLKLKYIGFRDFIKDWRLLAFHSDIYNFPIERIYELRSKLADVEIKPYGKPRSRSSGPAYVSGYRLFNKAIPLHYWEEDSWKAVIKLLPNDIIPYNVTGDLSRKSAKVQLAKLLLEEDVPQTRGKFNALKLGDGDLAMIWQVLPFKFDFEEFVMGHGHLPDGYLVGLMGDHGVRLQFFRLWNSKLKASSQENLRSLLDTKLTKSYFEMVPKSIHDVTPGINYSNAGPEVKNLISSLFVFRDSLNEEPKSNVNFWDFLIHYLGFDSSYLLHRNENWNRSTTLKVLAMRDLLNKGKVIEDYYLDSELISILKSAFSEDGDGLEGEFEEWLQNPVGAFAFEYKLKGGSVQLGTVVLGSDLSNFAYFLSMDSETAYLEKIFLERLMVMVCLLAVIFSIILGKQLAGHVVTPVNELSRKVTEFSEGNLNEPVSVIRSDEIGRMAFHFNEMVDNIEGKIHEMKSINSLNDSLLSGSSLSALMEHAVEEFCSATGAQVGYLGFFEQFSKEKLMGSAQFGISDNRLEDLELRLKVLVNKLDDDEFHFLPTYTAKNYDLDELFILKISPQSEPLQDVTEVLNEISDQEENEVTVQIEGFLVLGNFDKEVLNKDKLDFLHSFASQTGTVILKAYLDKIKKDNEEGQNIQEGLMPSEAPFTKNLLDISFSFVAAKYLGGDFYDFVEFNDPNYIGMVISDVSGKGVGPSLFGTTCQAYLRLLAIDPNNTGQTLEYMNERLCENKNNSLFATVFYLTINLNNLKMTYSSAGHNKMYLYRKKTHSIEYLSAKGLVLGMFTPCVYETRDLQLEEGDWIILYTDGITELENPSLDLYGMERFEQLILANVDKSAENMKELILEDLEIYRESVAPSDDITFILAKIESNVSNS